MEQATPTTHIFQPHKQAEDYDPDWYRKLYAEWQVQQSHAPEISTVTPVTTGDRTVAKGSLAVREAVNQGVL